MLSLGWDSFELISGTGQSGGGAGGGGGRRSPTLHLEASPGTPSTRKAQSRVWSRSVQEPLRITPRCS